MIATIMKNYIKTQYIKKYIFLKNRPQEKMNEKVVCMLINIIFQPSTGLVYTLDTNKQDYFECNIQAQKWSC